MVTPSVGLSENVVSFEVSGDLDHIMLSTDGSVLTNQVSSFSMIVSGDHWQTKDYKSDSSYREITCDDVSIFHFCKDDTFTLPEKYIYPTGIHVFVESAPIPSGGYAVEIPWLAYASTSVAQTNCADLPALWLEPRYIPNAHIYKSDIEVYANSPHLPREVTWVVTKERDKAAADNSWLNTEGLEDIRKVYRQLTWNAPAGFVGGKYKVITMTNIDGLTLPIAFELTTYYLSTKIPWEIYRGTNIIIKKMASKKIVPNKPGKPIFVVDYRFHDYLKNIDYLQYLAKGWIISPQSKTLQNFFARKINNPKLSVDDFVTFTYGPSPIFRYVIGITAIVPLLVIVTARICKKRAMSRRQFSK
jgi:hypothetical protein